MKPVLNAEEGKSVPVAIQGVMGQPEKPKRSRLVPGLLIGLIAVVVVALITGLSVYFGAKLTRDNFKEAKQLYHMADGKVVEEVSTVTETDVTIRVPNVVETVFDYLNGLVVERYIDSETKKKSACFARYLNETTAPSTDPDRYTEKEVSLNVTLREGSTRKWRTTTRKLSKHLVSETVAEMCKDTDIFWMERMEGNDRIEKRETCTYLFTYYECYPMALACTYDCDFAHFCSYPDGTYGVWYTTGYGCEVDCDPHPLNPYC